MSASLNSVEHRSDGTSVLCVKYRNIAYPCFIDTADYPLIEKYHWQATKFPKSRTMYATTSVGEQTVYMHRILIAGVEKVDHRDLNGLNNCRSNLRRATQSQQMANTGKRSLRRGMNPTSKYKGVHWDKQRVTFRAVIHLLGKTVYLGRFDSEIEAARVYNEAAKKHFGEFARLNALPEAA